MKGPCVLLSSDTTSFQGRCAGDCKVLHLEFARTLLALGACEVKGQKKDWLDQWSIGSQFVSLTLLQLLISDVSSLTP